VQNPQPRTLHKEFDCTFLTNSTLCRCKGVYPLQEQQDKAISDPNAILHSAGQCLKGAQPPSYADQCFLKAVTCIPAASVSLRCHCNSVFLGWWSCIPCFCNFTLSRGLMCSCTLGSSFPWVCSITVNGAA